LTLRSRHPSPGKMGGQRTHRANSCFFSQSRPFCLRSNQIKT
jgi:hypothetical protein